jgi:small subunit ribosomal protein S20
VAGLAEGDAGKAESAVLQAVKALDKAVTKGVTHPNTTARKKSRLVAKLNALKAS